LCVRNEKLDSVPLGWKWNLKLLGPESKIV